MLARSKLNSIENKLSEPLINNEIIHEDCHKLKESIRMMESQRNDTVKIIWLKKLKEKALMVHEYKTTISFCFKWQNYKKHKSKGLKN